MALGQTGAELNVQDGERAAHPLGVTPAPLTSGRNARKRFVFNPLHHPHHRRAARRLAHPPRQPDLLSN
ncbi:MAG: hypothetical protein WA817_22310 [Candidatus Acidiferrum sp.]